MTNVGLRPRKNVVMIDGFGHLTTGWMIKRQLGSGWRRVEVIESLIEAEDDVVRRIEGIMCVL